MKRAGFLISSFFLVFLMGLSLCFASQYDLKTMTPEVNQALKGRQARYQQLQSLKRAGIVGENNRGYAEVLKSDPAALTLVTAENADRSVIYQALVSQNELGPNGMKEVEKAFADVQNEKAAPGEMVQAPAGDWKRKS